MPAIADLYAAIKADMSEFDSDLQKGLTKSADRGGKTFGDRFKRQLTASNIGAGIGAALGGIGVAALRMGDDYDKAMDTIRIGTGATGDALAGLEADFKAVAARVPDDLATVSTVIADLNTRTGQTGEGLQALAEQVLDLSRITKTDAAANVANLTRLFGDWSIATEDQAATLDKVFRASQTTGVGVDQLATSVVQFGAPLRELNFDIDETLALFGAFEKSGVNTNVVMAGLKTGLGTLAKAGEDPRRAIDDLMESIETAGLTAENKARVFELFGKRAGIDMAKAIEEGRFAVGDLVDVVRNGGETISAATQDTEGLGEAWRQFKNIVATTVGPITKDLGGIASELGNLIFLLPALGGLVGKGLGALWTKAGGSRLIMGAVAAAGTLAGAAYRGAAFAFSLFADALHAVWVAMGAPGSKLITAAMASGRAAGIAMAAGAAAALLVIPLVVTSDQQSMDDANARILDVQRALEKLRGMDPTAEWGSGTVADMIEMLEVRLKLLDAGMVEVDKSFHEGAISINEARLALDATDEAAITASQDVAVAASTAVSAVTTAADAMSDTISEEGDDLVKQAQALMDAMGTVAARGVKELRDEEKEADKAWKNIIGAGDANKKRLAQVREDIDKWERRYKRAIRNNDSEAAAYASAQSTRLTDERTSRRSVVDAVDAQHDALKKLPEKTTTVVEAPGLQSVVDKVTALRSGLGSLYGTDIDIGISRPGPTARAAGGPVSANTPYVVGERGAEWFVPRVSGAIVANDRIGGDTYNFEPRIYGLPQQARTPREVVAELRRAARMGIGLKPPRNGWETT